MRFWLWAVPTFLALVLLACGFSKCPDNYEHLTK